jgi:hypothetical protein
MRRYSSGHMRRCCYGLERYYSGARHEGHSRKSKGGFGVVGIVVDDTAGAGARTLRPRHNPLHKVCGLIQRLGGVERLVIVSGPWIVSGVDWMWESQSR